MIRYYFLPYYFNILNIDKQISLINSKKIKTTSILIQIGFISGLIVILNRIRSGHQVPIISEHVSSSTINIILFMMGFFGALYIVLSYFIFFYIVSQLQVTNSDSIKRELFSISVLSYIPILIGIIINYILNLFYYNPYGYTNLIGLFQPEDKKIFLILAEFDFFKICSIVMISLLYVKFYKKSWRTFYIVLIVWLTINIGGSFLML